MKKQAKELEFVHNCISLYECYGLFVFIGEGAIYFKRYRNAYHNWLTSGLYVYRRQQLRYLNDLIEYNSLHKH